MTASIDIASGTITTTGSISSTSGHIHTQNGTGSFQTLACAGIKTLTSPDFIGIVMVLDSTATTLIDICADTAQYTDFATMSNIYTKRPFYDTTKIHACKCKRNTFINIK